MQNEIQLVGLRLVLLQCQNMIVGIVWTKSSPQRPAAEVDLIHLLFLNVWRRTVWHETQVTNQTRRITGKSYLVHLIGFGSSYHMRIPLVVCYAYCPKIDGRLWPGVVPICEI